MHLATPFKLCRPECVSGLAPVCRRISTLSNQLISTVGKRQIKRSSGTQGPADRQYGRVSLHLHRKLSTVTYATQSAQQLQEDQHHMAEAIKQARLAAQQQEVPVGAILVFNNEVIARAHNSTEQTRNPTSHAEMLCIQQAAAALGGWRLLESTLYVTLEPCPMCAGALLQSRVGTVVYGAKNTLLGADGSWISMLPQQPSDREAGVAPIRPHPFHEKMQVRKGVMADECSKLMQAFFKARRQAAHAAVKLP